MERKDWFGLVVLAWAAVVFTLVLMTVMTWLTNPVAALALALVAYYVVTRYFMTHEELFGALVIVTLGWAIYTLAPPVHVVILTLVSVVVAVLVVYWLIRPWLFPPQPKTA